jgi:hypothetical protein
MLVKVNEDEAYGRGMCGIVGGSDIKINTMIII